MAGGGGKEQLYKLCSVTGEAEIDDDSRELPGEVSDIQFQETQQFSR